MIVVDMMNIRREPCNLWSGCEVLVLKVTMNGNDWYYANKEYRG